MVNSSLGGCASRDNGGFGACERYLGWGLYMKGVVVLEGLAWLGFVRVFGVE